MVSALLRLGVDITRDTYEALALAILHDKAEVFSTLFSSLREISNLDVLHGLIVSAMNASWYGRMFVLDVIPHPFLDKEGCSHWNDLVLDAIRFNQPEFLAVAMEKLYRDDMEELAEQNGRDVIVTKGTPETLKVLYDNGFVFTSFHLTSLCMNRLPKAALYLIEQGVRDDSNANAFLWMELSAWFRRCR